MRYSLKKPPIIFVPPHKAGFTLIDVILSVAFLSVLAGISVPLYQGFQTRNDLDTAVNMYIQTVRRAQMLAQTVAEDTRWGVNITATNIVLFQGSSFASRNTAFDESFDTGSPLIITGMAEVVFEKFSGIPLAFGITTLTSLANESRTVIINEKGIISY